jgi:beta-lactamase superfamily II metal-dependent hydrolase
MRFLQILALATGVLGLACPAPALADHVVVKRNVVFHEGPSRPTPAIAYPVPGDAFQLLDDGQRISGYYHVARADGRRGWIYFTFVDRQPGDLPFVAGLDASSATMAVHYIDVDQGAAALLEFPCGAMMIDAGGRGDAARQHLLAYLNAFFARRTDLDRTIDTIVITHTHIDHDSNLEAVVGAFRVNGYIDNGIDHGSGRVPYKWIHDQAALPGSTIRLEDILEPAVVAAGGKGLTDHVIDPVDCQGTDPQIHVLSGGYLDNPGWPDGDFDNGNNASLVIRVDYGEASFLFTGDMEETAIETLLDRWNGSGALNTDVWEVGHHGSYNGTTPSLLAAITPRVAVISMGHEGVHAQWTAWAYGHPRRSAVDMIVAGVSGTRPATSVRVADKVRRFSDYPLSKAVYATGWDGDVTVRADAVGRISVVTGQ